ncbi:NADPH-dependent FMN reductase [Paenibacillus sp. GCM10012303]|jgi:NAD(P)H-dependent FMN reductase|uniref:NADPH-dependent FMN reductase n=1 Tax=Paenibacillus sp. GCM10012303 TaxID=3317340 RepID=UPI00362382AB
MKVVAIVGSIRKESYNRKLAEYVRDRYQDRFELEILSLRELPFYDQDIENEPIAAVRDFKSKVAEADAVLWVIPEYNGTIPGVLGNAIDWMSRIDRVLLGKPSWIMGASMGNLGTVKAQMSLRSTLFALQSPLLPGNEVYVGAVHEKIDAAGNLTHEPTVKFLDSVVDNFIAWYNRLPR